MLRRQLPSSDGIFDQVEKQILFSEAWPFACFSPSRCAIACVRRHMVPSEARAASGGWRLMNNTSRSQNCFSAFASIYAFLQSILLRPNTSGNAAGLTTVYEIRLEYFRSREFDSMQTRSSFFELVTPITLPLAQ
jgi:hypothetical protein